VDNLAKRVTRMKIAGRPKVHRQALGRVKILQRTLSAREADIPVVPTVSNFGA
jgi:hypothetical protein